MSDWQRDTTSQGLDPVGDPDVLEFASTPATRHTPADSGPSFVTPEGADWLASASLFPSSVHALWRHCPAAPRTLPCGIAFDVVSTPPLHGRRLLDRLWATGPGTGPVAVHRGRMLIFAAPGTAGRIAALSSWGEWRQPAAADAAGSLREPPGTAVAETFPSLMCHGLGDFVTVPGLRPVEHPGRTDERRGGTASPGRQTRSRWLVAPDLRRPWLPGAEVLLRACLRSHRGRLTPPVQPPVRAGRGPAAVEQSISGTADRDAKVYDVSRRR
ncbi:bifunctional DNA primase/polymerase [Streptomyces ovatisporus]|uniref:Bifunctional DNA primase/polymerase n=1 Tax=Streptomyces ovatisporus TaxID=1128682 RepID=A0ABV9A1Z5_9ACTN